MDKKIRTQLDIDSAVDADLARLFEGLVRKSRDEKHEVDNAADSLPINVPAASEEDFVIWDKLGWYVTDEQSGFQVSAEMFAIPECKRAIASIMLHVHAKLARNKRLDPFTNVQDCINAVLTIARHHPQHEISRAVAGSKIYNSCVKLAVTIFA